MITENRRARFELGECAMKRIAAVKHVVAQNQRHAVTADERFGDEKRLGDARRFQLFAIIDGESPRLAVAEQLHEARQVLRRGDDAQLVDAALDERRQRVIDHGLVIDGLELFARDPRERIQPRPGATGKNDSFHWPTV